MNRFIPRAIKLAAMTALAGVTLSASALTGRVFATGFEEPVFLTTAPGVSGVFIVEKRGVIYRLVGGVKSVFLDISSRVASDGERGLLGLAFDPQFASNGRFFVDLVEKNSLDTLVVRFKLSQGGDAQATALTGNLVIRVDQPNFSNHKAGWIAFRPNDGNRLYIATGDGGSGYDPDNNAQNGQVLLGKMLRLDVSGDGPGYTVPGDNPFVGSADVRPEIWALGLRNPFRPSFDRRTGNFWIADVGQDTREEINFEQAGDTGGHNYGWRLREGFIKTPNVGGNKAGLTDPVFDYPHTGPDSLGNAITGGYLYRGPAIPGANGRYFYGDYVAGKVYSMAATTQGQLSDLRDETTAFIGGTGLSGLGSFSEDAAGRLYALGTNGTIVVMCPDTAARRPVDPAAADPCE